MDCCASLVKLLLGILNFAFLLLGLALLVIGCIGVAGDEAIKSGFKAGFEAAGQFSNTNATNSPFAQEATKGIADVLKNGGVPLLIVGVIICFISVCGMFGVCCNSKGLMVIYMAALFVLLIAQIVFIALYLSGVLDKQFKDSMKKSIEDDYISYNSTHPTSAAWTLIMIELQCCGVSGYQDFNPAKKWRRQMDYNATAKVNLTTPIACCKPNRNSSLELKCATHPTDKTNNYKKGCYDVFKDRLGTYVVIFSFVILLFLLLLIAMMGYLIHQINNSLLL